MATQHVVAMQDLDAVENGLGVKLDYLEEAAVIVAGTFVATVQVQVSSDNINWANFGAALTATGYVKIDIAAEYVRAIATVYTSGTAKVSLVGRDSDRRG